MPSFFLCENVFDPDSRSKRLDRRHTVVRIGIFLDMVYGEDVKRIFRERGEKLVGCEISLFGSSALVISGHRGLSAISPEEIIVRRKGGNVRISGRDLRLEKASPSELYVAGEICAVVYTGPLAEVEA